MTEKKLLQSLLNAVTRFLDAEQELGFLAQADVDRIVIVEDMLSSLLLAKISKSNSAPPTSTITRLTYNLFDDDSNFDARFKKKNIQPEF